ncbi:MAG TPA: hypothetical protein VGW40_09870 [Allosphingosinicella sp.]|nr:hypothetical protein [Allosphingosinicella sp.]
MKLRMMAAIAVAAGLALAGPASAQRDAARGLEAPHVTPQAVRTLHAFARCVALESPARTRAALAVEEDSAGFANGIRDLADWNRSCLVRGTLRANEHFFAGRMAEALLLRDLRGQDLASRVAFDPARPPIRASNDAELMSICIVRAAPAEVAALFGTEPAGSQEAAAMQALVPYLSRCLRQGVEGHFNRPAIRSMLALAAYRLSENNRAAP